MSRHADRFTALLDACVLGGALRRNMLLSLAEAGLFRPRWSSRILDETQKAITQITKGETDGSRQRAAIEAAFPEALVTGYEIFEDKLSPVRREELAAERAAAESEPSPMTAEPAQAESEASMSARMRATMSASDDLLFNPYRR